MYPSEAIGAYCQGCRGEECQIRKCPLYWYRFGTYVGAGKKDPLGAIKAFCWECGGPDECRIRRCPLHPFRYGTIPGRMREVKK